MDLDILHRDVINLKRQAAEADQKRAEMQQKFDELLRFKASAEPALERAVMKSHEDGIQEARFADHDARISAIETVLSNRGGGGGAGKGSR